MTPHCPSLFFRRAFLTLARGPVPARLLPALAALCALALPPLISPALADQVNPAAHVIHSDGTGMKTAYDGENLTNLGGIEVMSTTLGSIGMFTAHKNSTLTNNGFIIATSTGGDAFGMYSNGLNSTLANYGAISVTSATDAAAWSEEMKAQRAITASSASPQWARVETLSA